MKFDELGYFRKHVDDFSFVFKDSFDRIECNCIVFGLRVNTMLSRDFIDQMDENFIFEILLNESKTSIKHLLESNPKKSKIYIKEHPKLNEYL